MFFGIFHSLFLPFLGVCLTESHLGIPDELQECYVNNNMQNFHLPMNMRVLLDIIRKAEKDSYATMDIRAMSSSLLHRYKFLIISMLYIIHHSSSHMLDLNSMASNTTKTYSRARGYFPLDNLASKA